MAVVVRTNKQYYDDVMNAMERNLNNTLRYIVGEARNLIKRQNRTGKKPSLPGEPPKRVTGLLRNAIAHEVTRTRTGIHGRWGYFGENAQRKHKGSKYPVGSIAFFLEFGTSRMSARPFMRPTSANTSEQVVQRLTALPQGAIPQRRLT